MPRQAKPYLYRGWWVSKIGGDLHKLCREEEGRSNAQEILDRLKVQGHENAGRSYPNLSVAELSALFMQSVEVESPASTVEHYRTKLQPFVKRLESKAVRQLHLTDGIAFKKALMETTSDRTGKRLGNCTVNHHIRAAKRVLNWAVNEAEYLPKNPWRKVKLLSEDGRRRIIEDYELRALLRHCTDTLFNPNCAPFSRRPGRYRCRTPAPPAPRPRTRRPLPNRHAAARSPRPALFVTHDREAILTQEVYQILAGYPDGNDAQALRHDPLFQTSGTGGATLRGD